MTWFYLGGSTQGVAADNSVELLALLRTITNRPATDLNLTDAKGYIFLTAAQNALVYRIAAHLPDLMKTAPEKMTTTDGGRTYRISKEALGSIEIYPFLGADQPLIEGPYWDVRADYTKEGTQTIRMQGNRPRIFADGPYARYVVKPGVIDPASLPTIVPNDLRRVLPWMAAAMWAATPGSGDDPEPYAAMVETLLWGDPASPGDLGIIPSYKLQHFSSGLSGTTTLDLWTRSPDLGR